MGKVVKSAVKVLPSAIVAGVTGGWLAFGAVMVAGTASALLMKAPKIQKNEHGAKLRLTVSPTAPRHIIYGEAVSGGSLLFRDTTGTDNKELHMIIALAGHEVEDITRMDWAGEEITFSGPNAVGKFANVMTRNDHLGSATQLADTDLVSSSNLWTSDHKLSGIAYVHMTLIYDEEKFSNGLQAMKFWVKGRKVYDPRLGQNPGSASDLANSNYYVWSDNPVLCALDYLLGVKSGANIVAGMGVSPDRIDWQNMIAEANICDEIVTLKSGGTEKRYTCNGILNPQHRHADNLKNITSAMAGSIVFQGGKWRMYAGAYRPALVSRRSDDVIGAVEMVTQKGWSEKMNGVRGVYADREAGYELKDYAPNKYNDFIAADGGQEFWMQVDLPFTNTATMAQRLSKIYLMRARMEKQCQVKFAPKALEDQCMDCEMFNHERLNMVNKVMRVSDWSLRFEQDEAGNVGLVCVENLIEEDPSIYTWDQNIEEITPNPVVSLPAQPEYHYTAGAIVETEGKHWAVEAGADKTANNIAADVVQVDGVLANTVRVNADLGFQADFDLDFNINFNRAGGFIDWGDGTSLGALKPASAGATRNNVITSASEPSGGVGDMWYDTFNKRFSLHSGSAWDVAGDITGFNTAADVLKVNGANAIDVHDWAAAGSQADADMTANPHINRALARIDWGNGYGLDDLRPAQAGADVTGNNAAADVYKVNGVNANIVQSNAQTGYDLTQNNGIKIDVSSLPPEAEVSGAVLRPYEVWTKEYTNPAPRWDTSFYVVQSSYFYGHTDTEWITFGEAGNTVYVPGAFVAANQVRAANFHDSVGQFNVNLGNGYGEGRGIVAGYSGGAYAGVGYNVRHTATSDQLVKPLNDYFSYIKFSLGRFEFYGDDSTTSGTTTLNSSNLLMKINQWGGLDFKNGWRVVGGESASYSGLYNTNHSQWHLLARPQGSTELYYGGSLKLATIDGGVQVNTVNGTLDIGALNANHCHFYTDRPTYYFNKMLYVNGHVTPYGNNIHDLGEISNKFRHAYLTGGVFARYFISDTDDAGSILYSRNTSAGSPQQFHLEHSYGNVILGNQRGDLILAIGNIEKARISSSGLSAIEVTATSDERLKYKVEDLPQAEAIKKVMAYRPVTYHWKDKTRGEGRQTGLIAQEVRDIDPAFVSEDGDGMLSVNYQKIVPQLIAVIQQQQADIDEMKTRLEAFEVLS